MELRVLRYFLAVAREERINRAAEVLHITQPTLSRQLSWPEEEIGVKLFHRGARRITLTNEGILLRRRAEEMLALVDKTEKALIDQEAPVEGRIRIFPGHRGLRSLLGSTAAHLPPPGAGAAVKLCICVENKQYGAMRAVGMDGRQITKMIAAEAVTYALSGCVIGCILGLTIGKVLFNFLIREHFAYAVWTFPVSRLLVVAAFVLTATSAAIYTPAKRMRNMAVTETINEL